MWILECGVVPSGQVVNSVWDEMVLTSSDHSEHMLFIAELITFRSVPLLVSALQNENLTLEEVKVGVSFTVQSRTSSLSAGAPSFYSSLSELFFWPPSSCILLIVLSTS